MSDPLTLFTRLIDEAFNAGNLNVLEELVAPNFVEHQFESPQRPARAVGPAGVARIVRELRAGADDFHLAIKDSSVTGDTVWVRLRATGTDTRGQLGRPPHRQGVRHHRHRHRPLHRRADGAALGRPRPSGPAPPARVVRRPHRLMSTLA